MPFAFEKCDFKIFERIVFNTVIGNHTYVFNNLL